MTLLSIVATGLFCITTPVAEMREKPTATSEIVSQALFSEAIQPLEEKEGWVKIETTVDHYQGWIKKDAFCQRKDENPTSVYARVNRLAAHLYSVEDTVFGPLLTVPFESRLEVIDPNVNSASRWLKVVLPDGSNAFIQRGDIELNPTLVKREDLAEFSKQFLGLPYTWGGRSSFGYDCSGFTQMLYRQMGIYLPRDSKDQIKWEGFKAIAMDQLQPNDLIFWGKDENAIRHVGMYIGEGKFIHISVRENKPYLRISKLSDAEWNGSGTYPFFAARTLK